MVARKRIIWFVFLVFLGSLLVLLNDLRSLDHFQQDEANWIQVSKFSFNTLFIDHNFNHQGWSESYYRFGKENPQFGKYLLGMSLYLYGYREFDGIVKWEPDRSMEWQIENGIIPENDELFAARLPVAILTAVFASMLCLLAILTLLAMDFHLYLAFVGGALAAVMFLVHPIVWRAGRRAMIDMPAGLFALAAFVFTLAAIFAIAKDQRRGSIICGSVGAIALGVGISTKFNALLVLPAILLCLLISYLILDHTYPQRKKLFKEFLFLTGLFIIVPPTIFIISNPYLWPDPVNRTAEIIIFWGRIIKGNYLILPTFNEKLQAFGKHSLQSIRSLFDVLKHLDLFLYLSGLLAIFSSAYRETKNRNPLRAILLIALLLWNTLASFAVLFMNPIPWPRYYLPAIPSIIFMEAVGLIWLAWLGWSAVKIGVERVQHNFATAKN